MSVHAIPNPNADHTVPLFGTLLTLFRNLQDRKKFAELSKMDDHMLYDIRIKRGDLRHASSLPLTVNPFRKLNELRRGFEF